MNSLSCSILFQEEKSLQFPGRIREIAVSETVLFRWVRDERRRMEALAGTSDEPLSASERAELVRLRRQVAEQEKDNEFLKKAAAYFAANPPKRKGSL